MLNDFVPITCCHESCHVTFGMARGFYDRAKGDSKQYWYCPNGHSQHFSQSEADKMRLERDRAVQNAAYLQDRLTAKDKRLDEEKRRAAAARGQVTKIKNRVGRGVCPCCNRSFGNLHRHMATQHPTFTADEAAA